jgi:hypothetical protein
MQKMHRGGMVVAGISIKADPNGDLSITQIPLKVTLLNVKTKMNLADAQLVSLTTGAVVSQKITAKSTGEGSWNLSIKCADLMVAAGAEEKFLLTKPYRTTGMAAIGVALGDKNKFSWSDGQKTFAAENTKFLSDADYSGNVYRTNF